MCGENKPIPPKMGSQNGFDHGQVGRPKTRRRQTTHHRGRTKRLQARARRLGGSAPGALLRFRLVRPAGQLDQRRGRGARERDGLQARPSPGEMEEVSPQKTLPAWNLTGRWSWFGPFSFSRDPLMGSMPIGRRVLLVLLPFERGSTPEGSLRPKKNRKIRQEGGPPVGRLRSVYKMKTHQERVRPFLHTCGGGCPMESTGESI